MSTTVRTASPAGERTRPASISTAAEPAVRRMKPVKWWAALGAAYVGVVVYSLIHWNTAGEFHKQPYGPSELPDYARWTLTTLDIISPIAGLAIVYFWGIRPWIRQRRMPTDAKLIIAWLFMWFSDPLPNYLHFVLTYNAYFWQTGSWLGSVPTLLTPGAHLFGEPLSFIGFGYVWGIFAPGVLGCAVMRRCRRRWPSMGNVGLLGCLFIFWIVVDLIAEPFVLLRLEVWSFPGAIQSLSLFGGTKYQFPIYELPIAAAFYVGVGALRWFVDDKGRTVAERGIDDVRLPARRKTLVSLLGTIGAAALIINLMYNLPMVLLSLHADPPPKDMPSYFLPDSCGITAPYVCPAVERK